MAAAMKARAFSVCNRGKTCKDAIIRNFPIFHHHRMISTAAVNLSGYERWRAPFMKKVRAKLKHQDEVQGIESEKPRSWWANWNYDAELFSFGARLGERISNRGLRRAFLHQSYLDKVEREHQRVQLETDESLEKMDNSDLAEHGAKITSEYLTCFLKQCYTALPDEGVTSIKNFLTSTELVSHIAKNMGCYDLVYCAEFPVSGETLEKTFFAIVGIFAEECGLLRAQLFVRDFLITSLIDKDINDIWWPTDPLKTLDLLHSHGTVEPRLIQSTGSNTVMACYLVGIYCNRNYLGEGAGESISIATEMAARDALEKIFGTSFEENNLHLMFGKGSPLLNDSNPSQVSDERS